ncbi:MAG TPA: Ig-like domain-containing protein [Verrucomicrobiae bacterium]|jgi:hypothetical protein
MKSFICALVVVIAAGGSFASPPAPTLTITLPAANQSLTNATVTVKGTAHDSVGLARVYCGLNGAALSVTSSNHWSNWMASSRAAPGPNVIEAYAVNTASVASVVKKVNFTYVVKAPLAVTVNGKGAVSPNYMLSSRVEPTLQAG